MTVLPAQLGSQQLKRAGKNEAAEGDAEYSCAVFLQEVLESIAYTAQELKRRLPGVPVVNSLGNYDFVPMHSDPGPPLNSWILHPVAEMISEWLDAEALETFKYAGYYEVRGLEGLKI